jgi:hypothetical protein
MDINLNDIKISNSSHVTKYYDDEINPDKMSMIEIVNKSRRHKHKFYENMMKFKQAEIELNRGLIDFKNYDKRMKNIGTNLEINDTNNNYLLLKHLDKIYDQWTFKSPNYRDNNKIFYKVKFRTNSFQYIEDMSYEKFKLVLDRLYQLDILNMIETNRSKNTEFSFILLDTSDDVLFKDNYTNLEYNVYKRGNNKVLLYKDRSNNVLSSLKTSMMMIPTYCSIKLDKITIDTTIYEINVFKQNIDYAVTSWLNQGMMVCKTQKPFNSAKTLNGFNTHYLVQAGNIVSHPCYELVYFESYNYAKNMSEIVSSLDLDTQFLKTPLLKKTIKKNLQIPFDLYNVMNTAYFNPFGSGIFNVGIKLTNNAFIEKELINQYVNYTEGSRDVRIEKIITLIYKFTFISGNPNILSGDNYLINKFVSIKKLDKNKKIDNSMEVIIDKM